MSWERTVLALFDDLEQQAEGLALSERDVEVGELSRAEYAQVDLVSRLHASVTREVRIRLVGGRLLAGRMSRVGADWVLLEDLQPAPSGAHGHHPEPLTRTEHLEGPAESGWLVPMRSIATASGVSTRSRNEKATSVVARLSMLAMLRRLGQVRSDCVLHLVDGTQVEGRLGRVGRDFVEVHSDLADPRFYELVPVAAVSVLCSRS